MKKYNRKLGSKRDQGIVTRKAPQNTRLPSRKRISPHDVLKMCSASNDPLGIAAKMGVLK